VVGVMVNRWRLPLCHVLFSHTGRFLHDPDPFFSYCVFGLGSKCIHGTTVKYTKRKRDSIKLTREDSDSYLLFSLPPRAWSPMMADMVRGSRSRTHAP